MPKDDMLISLLLAHMYVCIFVRAEFRSRRHRSAMPHKARFGETLTGQT